MTSKGYFRWSLMVPPVVLSAGAVLGMHSNGWFFAILGGGLAIGILPYAVLASYLLWRSRNQSLGSFKKALLLSPLLLVPLLLAEILVEMTVFDRTGEGNAVVSALGFTAMVAIYAVPISYVFVALVFVGHHVLSQRGVIRSEA